MWESNDKKTYEKEEKALNQAKKELGFPGKI